MYYIFKAINFIQDLTIDPTSTTVPARVGSIVKGLAVVGADVVGAEVIG